MIILLQAVDEMGELEKSFGGIEQESIRAIIRAANDQGLDCLSGLDMFGDTYFNDKQCRTIYKELFILRQDKKIDDQVLDLIQEGVHFVSNEGYVFLEFVGGA